MPEGSQFNFWAPGQVDTSGVQQGAAGLLAGGQGMARGIAAAGEAKAAAYKHIGTEIAGGIQRAAKEKKAEELAESIDGYFDMVNDPNKFDDVPWMHAESQTQDQVFRMMYQEHLSKDGDPNANLGELHQKQTRRFMEHYGKNQADAEAASQGLLQVHTKKVMNPQHRAAVQKARARIIGLGADPRALYDMAQGRGAGGSPNLQSLTEDMSKEAQESFFTMTPGEKEAQLWRREEWESQVKEEKAAAAKQKLDVKIQGLLYEPMTLPDVTAPEGAPGLPTGLMKPRGHEQITLGEESGDAEQFLMRAEADGYPLAPIRKKMAEKHGVQFIGKNKAAQLRAALRESGVSESGIADEMTSLMAFSDRSDPNYDKWIKGQVEAIDKGKLAPEFQKRDTTRQYGGTTEDTYDAVINSMDRSAVNGSATGSVRLQLIQNVDLDAFVKTFPLEEQAELVDMVGQIRVGHNEDGSLKVLAPRGSNLDDGVRVRIGQLLDTQDASAELGLLMATGGTDARSKVEVNMVTRKMMREDPERYAKMIGGGQAPGHVKVPGSTAGSRYEQQMLGMHEQGHNAPAPAAEAPAISTEGMDAGSSALFDQVDIRKVIVGPTVTPRGQASAGGTAKPTPQPNFKKRVEAEQQKAAAPAPAPAPQEEKSDARPVAQKVSDAVGVLNRMPAIGSNSGKNSVEKGRKIKEMKKRLYEAHKAGDKHAVEGLIEYLPEWAKENGLDLPKMRMGGLEAPFKKRYDKATSNIKDKMLMHAKRRRQVKYKSTAYDKAMAGEKKYRDLAFELETAYREGRDEDANKIIQRWIK